MIKLSREWSGAAEPGGSGGVGPPLEFEIYLVNFLKNCKKRGFFSIGPPLGKNRSSAPGNDTLIEWKKKKHMGHILKLFQCKKTKQKSRNFKNKIMYVCVKYAKFSLYQGKKKKNLEHDENNNCKKKLYDVFHTIISRIYYCTWK